MLDDRKTKSLQQYLKVLPYQERVNIFDRNCGECPYREYTIRKTTMRNSKDERLVTQNFDLARETAMRFNVGIQRNCRFNEDRFSLNEIIINGCQFWNHDELDEGIFIEITVAEKVEFPIWLSDLKLLNLL